MGLFYRSDLDNILKEYGIPADHRHQIIQKFGEIVLKNSPYHERLNAIRILRRNGMTQREISKKLNMSLRDVNHLCMRENLVRGRKHEY